MQFFPADITMLEGKGINSTLLSSTKQIDSVNGFGGVLSSFIEEDRYDYTGRPAGFAAFGPEMGTIDFETASRIARELRSRKVPELSVGQFESLAASGSPLTIGTVFNSLSGRTRLTEELSDAEMESFMLVLDKLGFSRLEKEEILALSDNGDTKGMWALLSRKLQSMDPTADINRKEWNALLRGLDTSPGTRKDLLVLFAGESGDLEMRELTGAQIEELLAPLRGEYAEREQAAAYARTQARGAIVASFEAIKAGKSTAPVEDTRGSRLLEQKEVLMQNSMRKNTGIDQIMDSDTEQPVLFRKAGQDNHAQARNGEQRQEQTLFRGSDQRQEHQTPIRGGEQGQERNVPIRSGEQSQVQQAPSRNAEQGQNIQNIPTRNAAQGQGQGQEHHIPIRFDVQGQERNIPTRNAEHSQVQQAPIRSAEQGATRNAGQGQEHHIPTRSAQPGQENQAPTRNAMQEQGHNQIQHTPTRSAMQGQGQDIQVPFRISGNGQGQYVPVRGVMQEQGHSQIQYVPTRPVEHNQAQHILAQSAEYNQAKNAPTRNVMQEQGHNQVQHTPTRSAMQEQGHSQVLHTPARNADHNRNNDARHNAEQSFEQLDGKARFEQRGPSAPLEFQAARRNADNQIQDTPTRSAMQEQGHGQVKNAPTRNVEQSQAQHTPARNVEHNRNNDTLRHGDNAEQPVEHGDGKAARFERNPFAPSEFQAARRSAETERPAAAQAVDRLLQNINMTSDAVGSEFAPATAVPAQNLNSIARSFRQEIFSQVEQGILSGTQNGTNRLTLQLNPVELGQVTVILSVHQGEVKATIRADQPESAGILREQMGQLKAALEAEGLKVKELDVQTSLREELAADQRDGHQEHNLMRDAEERDRMMRLARIRRNAAGQTDQTESLESAPRENEQAGLHIVA